MGRSIKVSLINPADAYWDWRLGIKTFGYYPANGVGTSDWRVHYTPTPYSDVFRHLLRVGVTHNDVYTDLGSGLGRTVFAAAFAGVRRSIGVEIVPELVGLAKTNLAGCVLVGCPIEFVLTHAAGFDLSDTTIMFMAHSFGEVTLRQVVENIEGSKRASPLRVIYVNPVFDRVFAQSKKFKSVGKSPKRFSLPTASPHYETTFWQTV